MSITLRSAGARAADLTESLTDEKAEKKMLEPLTSIWSHLLNKYIYKLTGSGSLVMNSSL